MRQDGYVDLTPLVHVTDIAEGFMKGCGGLQCVSIPSNFIRATMGSYFMQRCCPVDSTDAPILVIFNSSDDNETEEEIELFRKHSIEVAPPTDTTTTANSTPRRAMRVSIPAFKLLHKKPAAPGQR